MDGLNIIYKTLSILNLFSEAGELDLKAQCAGIGHWAIVCQSLNVSFIKFANNHKILLDCKQIMLSDELHLYFRLLCSVFKYHFPSFCSNESTNKFWEASEFILVGPIITVQRLRGNDTTEKVAHC